MAAQGSDSIAEGLRLVPMFRGVAPEEVARTAPSWSRVQLETRQTLWSEGGLATELGVVASGSLLAVTGGVEVGEVRVGELAGEASAFFRGEIRSATITAGEPTVVFTLPVKALARLRREGSPVYDALLAQALRTLVRRVRAADLRIARLAEGDRDAPSRREPSTLARLWRRLRPGKPGGQPPELDRMLRTLPTLRAADAGALAALSAAFAPMAVEEGQVLFLEGEPADAAFLVAKGSVEVLRNVRGDRAELLATLGPGDLIGVNTLVERGPRSASCVAASPGWLYRVDSGAAVALTGAAARLWSETMLAALASQIRAANAALNRVVGDLGARPPPDREYPPPPGRYDALVRASGHLEGASLDDAHLDGLDTLTIPPE